LAVSRLALISDQLGFKGGFWELVGAPNDNLNNLGVIIGLFLAAFQAIYKSNAPDRTYCEMLFA